MRKLFPFLIFLILAGINTATAQKQAIKDLYFDYTQSRTIDTQNALTLERGLALLERSSELNDKQIANVSFNMGRIYDADGLKDKAVPYYERALKLAPGYYVTYRALGYIYLKKCDSLGRRVSESAKLKNAALNAESFKAYKVQVLKTAACFEKAEACDPDERTNAILKSLYTSIKDTEALSTLPARLAAFGKDCTTLLDDE